MAQGNEEKLKYTFSLQDWILYLSLGLFALIGVLCIFGGVYLKHASCDSVDNLLIFQLGQSIPRGVATDGVYSPDVSGAQPAKPLADLVKELVTGSGRQDGLFADLLRDLGIALVISVFVTVAIELRASGRLREHIAFDVLSAAYAKVVPEEIYTQIRDNVFRSMVYRRNWDVRIKGDRQQVDKSAGTAIINAKYSYDLENLNERKIKYPVSIGIDLDVLLPGKDIPKLKLIAISDERDQPLIQEEHATALLGKQNELTSSEGNLTFERTKQEMLFIALVPISARGRVKITFEVERAIRIPGNFVLNAPVPADGIKITLNVDGFQLAVLPLHPNRLALRNPQPDTWQFDDGILPWQGFRFTAHPRDTA